MDGLMIDSEPIQSKSFEYVLKHHGKKPKFNKDGVIQMVGISSKANWLALKKKHQLKPSVGELLRHKEEIYRELLRRDIRAQKGLVKLLRRLKSKGYKLAIASSSELEYIKMVVKELKVQAFFEHLISGAGLKRGKPFPDIFLKTAKNLRVKPQNCLVLEDSESGVKAAHAAGMRVVAVPNKFTRSHDFDKAHARVRSLDAITLEFIGKL